MEQRPMLSRFRNSEQLQFFVDANEICNKADLPALKIENQVKELVEATLSLSNYFVQETGSQITQELTTMDNSRDTDVKITRKVTSAYLNHFDEAKAKAARLILRTMDKYGKDIAKMNYQAETTVLTNLSRDFQSPECTEAINLLGLSDVCNHMFETNQRFNALFISRIGERADNTSLKTAELMKQATSKWNTLVDHIEAYQIIMPSDGLAALIKKLDELIAAYNSTVSARTGKQKEVIE